MIKRHISKKIIALSKKYPVIALTGPRQSGKSTLVKTIFPKHQYITLENPSIREFAENDPQAFMNKYCGRVIFDEIQYVPLLLSFIQSIVDDKKKMADFVITGSSQFKLRQAITQSLAGRVCIFQLLPLSIDELASEKLNKRNFLDVAVTGFYPAIFDRNIAPHDFFSDYLQTYVERDVRSLINVSNLRTFQLFLKMCASRVGSMLNLTSLGNDIGVSRETIKSWINVLEASYIAFLLPPYFTNINKRLSKTPKLYFYDVGLLCYLLGMNEKALMYHPLRGGVFENLIINELQKKMLNQHISPNFYFYSEQSGVEVDLIVPKDGRLIAIEIKSASTYNSDFVKNLSALSKHLKNQIAQSYVVYTGQSQNRSDISVLSWKSLKELPF